jgi:hypothetical protein
MKNIIFIPMVIPQEKKLDKFGGWGWMDYSKKAWEYWCNKNNCELVIYDSPSISDTDKFRVTVQRFMDVFDFLKSKNIEYDQVAMIDACMIPHWDCPNFFNLTNNKLTVSIDNDNLGWVYESVKGYQHMFNNFKLDIKKYFCSGFVIFNKSHESLLQKFKTKYLKNSETFYELQTKTVRKSTCQTPLNYIVQMNQIDTTILPSQYRVSHLYRKELAMPLTYSKDPNNKLPLFIENCYLWQFSGFDKTTRNNLMFEVWNLIKEKYQ